MSVGLCLGLGLSVALGPVVVWRWGSPKIRSHSSVIDEGRRANLRAPLTRMLENLTTPRDCTEELKVLGSF